MHALTAFIENVGVNHRCTDIRMPEKLLDGSDIVAILEQVCSKRMTKGMTPDTFYNPGPKDGFLYSPLEKSFCEDAG